ncbi:MAG: GMC family oxidoreductase [candidate division Zixibacteria bacterium]|nr:GMC family oxidoreductase [candidate division Zixibacteria bacterium]
MPEQYDVICVGTGFATSFFLLAYLKKAKPTERILVLERGRLDTLGWQLDNKRSSSVDPKDTYINRHKYKQWDYNPGFGGGSNRWWACTPRMMPNDFQLETKYGVGIDWPISYDEIEDYYYQAELAMAVSGPNDGSPYPRANPYPQPPHMFSDADRMFKKAYPDKYFIQPTARARVETANRNSCCAHGYCTICPIDSKFTILNEMAYLYDDPRVTLLMEATVRNVETRGNLATGVTYFIDSGYKTAESDLVVLGANTIFNPFILLKSGINHQLTGKYLREQVSKYVTIDLDGIDNFGGSTSITGHGYMLYDGDHRSSHAGCLIESLNVPHAFSLRPLRGRWRQRLIIKTVFEDLAREDNYVKISDENPDLPETVYSGHSDYAQRGIDALPELIAKMLSGLPVDNFEIAKRVNHTDSHIIGTVVMGNDPAKSVVDRYLIHHDYRNLVVLGSCTFPTASPANPALTLSALSLWSADHLMGKAV